VIDSDILAAARRGDTRAIARVLTSVENRTDEGAGHFASLFADAGGAWITGVTGAPGAGKSTMVSGLIPLLTPDEGRLAVVAVDPSSPFSGGAILGDRIRMMEHVGDDRVFIRSLANRGSLGGISESTPSVLAAMDGLGFDEIVVETVGVGQSEVEIATSADTTVVVVSPGWGDAIQVSKAGFLEVADVLVVNKADIAGAEAAVRDLTSMLAIGPDRPWTPPVVMTTSTTGAGMSDLVDAIRSHRAYLDDSGDRDRRRRIRAARELAAAVRRRVEQTVDLRHDVGLVARVAAHEIDPWTAADILVSTDGAPPSVLA
jgi:LAO/AO transport system kinase